MSIYFDKKLVLPDSTNFGYGKRIFIDVQWHKKFPVLAISHSDDKSGPVVSVYDHTKEETVNVDSTPQPGVQITAIAWHPVERLLSIGYETGEVIVWNHEEGEVFEGSRGHSAAVMLMEWSHDGSLLVTSDNMGILIIWKSDAQGHLQTQAIHDFKDPVCNIVFRQKINLPQRTEDDDTGRALGTVTSWRPKTGRKRGGERTSRRESFYGSELEDDKCFFVGVLSGTIYYLRGAGSSEEILSSGSSIKSLLYYLPKDMLIVMTEAQIMGQFHVDSNGNLKEITKMKLGGHGEMQLFWVGNNTLAIVGKDPFVRLWDVESGDNTVLEAKRSEVGDEETFLSVEYHPLDGIVCCCTTKGKLVMWKEKEPPSSDDGENKQTQDDHWVCQGVTLAPTSSKVARWCLNVPGLLAVNAIQDVIILQEQALCYFFGQKINVVQTQPSQLSVNLQANRKTFDIKTDIQIQGISASSSHIAMWSSSKVVVYEVGEHIASNYKYTGSFGTKADAILIHDLSLYLQEQGQILVRTFQGTIKQTLQFTEQEGPPVTMAIGGDFFTVGSESGFLKIWHIGRREAKLHTNPRDLNECIPELGEIISANTNLDGSKVAFVIAKTNLVPDSRLFVMDISRNVMVSLAFPDRFIEKFIWESHEPNYMAIEVKKLSRELQEIVDQERIYGGGMLDRGDGDRADEIRLDNREEKVFIDLDTLELKRDWISVGKGTDDQGGSNKAEGGGKGGGDSTMKSKVEMTKCDKADLPKDADQVVLTLYVEMERGILIHETRSDFGGKSLVGIEVPYLYLLEQGNWNQKNPMLKDTKSSGASGSLMSSSKVRLDAEMIKDFEGVEDEAKVGRDALMKYVFLRLSGDIDGALSAIRDISNKKIYENLVRNCVHTQRLDVALFCLAKLGDAVKAKQVRDAMIREPEIEAQVGMLAIGLNMMDDAERLYIKCKRYDLLLDLYTLTEQWEKAVRVCETHRRIQLRTTYHAYAKHLESQKKIIEAIEVYEKAETHRYEVPRMLLDEPEQLQAYVVKKKDKELYQWWAQYLESTGEIESALRYYELGHDWLSLVRLLCYLGNYDEAVKMAEKAEDKASAYHLARTLEDKGELETAMNFYSRAGAYGHAVRMCKENNMPDELWAMALHAEPLEMAEAAKYFENEADQPNFDRAIRLYHKAGYDSKALELAFSHQEFSALQSIVKDIMSQTDVKTDPLLLQKCASYFVDNKEIEKALDMLCAAQKYPEAMELCVEQKFTITDAIAERLTAPKGAAGLDEQTRVRLLEKMGECCSLQGSYHLAAKKYTQAGNKIQAMKSLMKSGDTERIIFYANVSRHRDIYVLAANYLQTTDWRGQQKIVDLIIQYYSKAQAYESLAGFYANVAEYCIEDLKDYRKALDEYRKAENALSDLLACGARQYEEQFHATQAKIHTITKFLSIKERMSLDPDGSLLEIKKMMEGSKGEMAVRTGDVYALIVEHYANRGNVDEALTVLEEMRKFIPSKNLPRYLTPQTINKVEELMRNNPSRRVLSGDKETSKQRERHSANYGPPTSLPMAGGVATPTTPANLHFLTGDLNESVIQSRGINSSRDTEDDEDEEDEDESVEDIDDETDEVVEEEEAEEEEESEEDEDEADDLANKNPGQKLQYASLFGTTFR